LGLKICHLATQAASSGGAPVCEELAHRGQCCKLVDQKRTGFSDKRFCPREPMMVTETKVFFFLQVLFCLS
jgi:hypothetical protein